MTTGSNASRANELMQEGIRQVRDGRMNEAYRIFREVVDRDPNNEYAWIWISQTSPDRTERRQAIDRAFQLNPNSQHAQQALSRFQQEEAAMAASSPPNRPQTFRPGVIGGDEAPGRMGGPVKLTQDYNDPNDLRSSMGADEGRAKKGRGQAKNRTTEPRRATPTTERRRRNPLRLILLVLLVVIIGGVVLYLIANKTQTTTISDVAPTTAPADTTAVAGSVTPGVDTTTAAVSAATTAAATTVAAPAPTDTAGNGNVALVPTPTLVSGATSATTPAATTAATTSAAATTASSITPAATTAAASTAVPGTNSSATGGNDPLTQAQQLIQSGNYKGAISLLNDAVKANPSNLAAQFRLGSAYLAAPVDQLETGVNRYDEALKSFKRVTDLAPTWPGGYARLGETYAAKGDLPAAIAAFSRSLELDPNGPERWLALAQLYDRSNLPAEAAYARSRAQGLNPTPVSTSAAPAPTPTVK